MPNLLTEVYWSYPGLLLGQREVGIDNPSDEYLARYIKQMQLFLNQSRVCERRVRLN